MAKEFSSFDESRNFAKGRFVKVETSEGSGNILMSNHNPGGHKLEELLSSLVTEVEWKSEAVVNDKSFIASSVLQNNEQICGLLRQAAAIQRSNFILMGPIAKDDGPAGNPRIGEGS